MILKFSMEFFSKQTDTPHVTSGAKLFAYIQQIGSQANMSGARCFTFK